MNIGFLTREAFCGQCNQWIIMKPGEDWLPDHQNEKREKCSNSGYSPDGFKYKIKTAEEAKRLAKIISKDNGECLHGGRMHSLACGDGEHCTSTRLLLSKALAGFILENR